MALEIGKNSYVTLEEADNYIADSYMSSSAQLNAWSEISDRDKEIALKNAVRAMEEIIYIGYKKDSSQELSFPRCYKQKDIEAVEWYETKVVYGRMHCCDEDVPCNVKYAQIEEALELACPTEDSKDYDALNGAVSAYSISSMSETFRSGSFEGDIRSAMHSKRAQRLLKEYTGGGYCVD